MTSPYLQEQVPHAVPLAPNVMTETPAPMTVAEVKDHALTPPVAILLHVRRQVALQSHVWDQIAVRQTATVKTYLHAVHPNVLRASAFSPQWCVRKPPTAS